MSDDDIPLVDLRWQHAVVGDEVAEGFAQIMATGGFIGGHEVSRFEEELAAFCDARWAVGVANGTDALELALRAAGVRSGDEVILPANTFIATAEPVVRIGATPVFVDADPDHLLIDTESVADRLTPRTRAIMPVHLYGQLAPMQELLALIEASGTDVVLVGDAAQAQGATAAGQGIAASVVAAGTSFYPGKNLGAYGDAGAVLTNDADTAARVRSMASHGTEGDRYLHPNFGFNSRLDALQAVVLRAKLKHLEAWNKARLDAARRYDELLAETDGLDAVVAPATRPGNDHVWHLYVVRVPHRDAVLDALRAEGIGAGVHYPVPLHLQGAFADLGHGRGDFPVAESAAESILSLPLFPGITDAQQCRVVETLSRVVRRIAERTPGVLRGAR